jgi:hypothetical protein
VDLEMSSHDRKGFALIRPVLNLAQGLLAALAAVYLVTGSVVVTLSSVVLVLAVLAFAVFSVESQAARRGSRRSTSR